MRSYDLAVVGAGIVGLAHALAAARLGKHVVVIDRDRRASGASIRNFGFVTVTGQERGRCWERARRSREVWAEVAPQAGIAILQRGLLVAARRAQAMAVLEAFAATEMGAACRLLAESDARGLCPVLAASPFAGGLWSPHELRVESRDAVPRLAAWLAAAHRVDFRWGTLVTEVTPPMLRTTAGPIAAEACVVCPGDDFLTLFPDRLAAYGLTRCKLHMLRTAPQPADWRLPGAVMSDLSLTRYRGYAALPEAEPLRASLHTEEPGALAAGIHLIVVRSADGSLVIGDSHHYDPTPDPFAPSAVDALILRECANVLSLAEHDIVERWTGTYASAPDRLMLVDRPSDAVRLVLITSGTGASTAFAIAEEVVGELFGNSRPTA